MTQSLSIEDASQPHIGVSLQHLLHSGGSWRRGRNAAITYLRARLTNEPQPLQGNERSFHTHATFLPDKTVATLPNCMHRCGPLVWLHSKQPPGRATESRNQRIRNRKLRDGCRHLQLVKQGTACVLESQPRSMGNRHTSRRRFAVISGP